MVSPADTTQLSALLDALLALQQERALAYQRLNEGFKLYLTNLEEGPYQSLLTKTTQEFSALSTRAREIEADLRGPLNRSDAADIVRSIQENEQAKLYDTIAIQAMRGSVAAKRFSWQHMAEGDDAPVSGSCCGHGHGDAAEPTEFDVKNVTHEAYQHLETCVTAINENIQELRQLREEL